MIKNQTCCFTGHREIPEGRYLFIKERLEAEIIELIGRGVRYFIFYGRRCAGF